MTSFKQLERGTEEIISKEELKQKLRLDRPLRIKVGFDPTAPDLHLGHTILLRKMRQFQDLGHEVIFLVGDFTATIGDPSGRSKVRKQLSPQEVIENSETYERQIYKVLDPKKTIICFNNEWNGPTRFANVLELTSHITVARLLERDDFKKRLEMNRPLSMLEVMYPLIQGRDSVELEADIELGGTDQKFNLLVGRTLQQSYGQTPQVVITLPLIEGLDGQRKMSKSLNNAIGLFESPRDMYGKIMSLPDALILRYFELLTDVPYEEINRYQKELEGGKNPKEIKIILAKTLVSMYHSTDLAHKAAKEFDTIFVNKGLPDEMKTVEVTEPTIDLIDLIKRASPNMSKSEIRRLIIGGGISLDQTKIMNLQHHVHLNAKEALILKIGKLHFYRIVYKRS